MLFMLSDKLSENTLRNIKKAIDEHRLPSLFIETVIQYYTPLAQWMALRISQGQSHILGMQGSQGSGKSTCAHFLQLLLEQEFKLKVAVVSLDDFYLTKSERTDLARKIHPLFETRGVPGTHDVALIQNTFDAVRNGKSVLVPTFDKAADDRLPISQWQSIASDIDVLIFEGWCVGVPPKTANQVPEAINALESDDDPAAKWRSFVNDQLKCDYASIYSQLDTLVALQAPSFDCVFNWRLLQEQKLIARLEQAGKDFSGAQTPEQIQRFISHYQRLTEHAIATMPDRADALLHLNADHSFEKLVFRESG